MGRGQPAAGGPPDVKPLDVDGVRTVAIVTVFWGVAFVLLALRQGTLSDAGRGWWMWTCLAGVGLGLLGLEYCRKRRDAIARAALDAEAAAPDDADDWSGVGDWSQLPNEPDDEFRYDTDPHNVPAPSATGEFAVPAPSATGEFAVQPSDDQQTMPYSPAGRPPPGHVTGDMPAVSPITGEQPPPPVAAPPLRAAHSAPEPQRQPAAPPPAPAQHPLGAQPPRQASPPVAPQRPAQRPATERPAQRPATERPGQPEQWPAAGEPDPYSTGSLHAAPAGYTPEPERRHPRDREYSARTGEIPADRPPAPSQPYEPLADEAPPDPGRPLPRSRPYVDPAQQQPPSHSEPPPSQPSPSQPSRGAQDSEFFDDIPPRSEPDVGSDDDSDSLLGDLVGDAGDGRQAPAADDDDQEHRSRRSRRSRRSS